MIEHAALAAEMLEQCVVEGQAVRRIHADTEAALLRQALRGSAKRAQLRIRTGRLDDTVVVVRVDADLWSDDTATMRTKLRPADG